MVFLSDFIADVNIDQVLLVKIGDSCSDMNQIVLER